MKRLVRVVSGIMSCPQCGKHCLHSVIQAGWAFQQCGVQRSSRESFERHGHGHGRCDANWWTLAIPPDAPAGHLCAIMGEDMAKRVLARAYPEIAKMPEPERWYELLNPGNEQAWIQIAVRPRERHLYRTAKLALILNTFLAA